MSHPTFTRSEQLILGIARRKCHAGAQADDDLMTIKIVRRGDAVDDTRCERGRLVRLASVGLNCSVNCAGESQRWYAASPRVC